MVGEERRADSRIDSPNLLAFNCCDESQNVMAQGMGRTVNISEGGLLLETHIPVSPEWHICLTIALEEDLMDFKGEIVHTRKNDRGLFLYGVQFTEMNDKKRRFLKQYLLILNGQENENLKNDQGA